ncbi:hypothetical protein GCM10020367_61140 [Streptomyces sannanensis]|uniref:Uncharacterized protein n=1 Tax=Streptomyces sannanensis TaxID=285536 RepID=A0ABP6SKA2_9ACTN
MGRADAYELVFTDAVQEAPGTEDIVVVHRTDRSGPGGHPIYADDTGIVQAEISDRGEVRMIASSGHQQPSTVVQARPLA